jgi:predicted permease
MSTDIEPPSRATTRRAVTGGRHPRSFALLATGAAAALTWIAMVPVSGVDLRAPAHQGSADSIEIGLVPVLLVSVGATALGWGLLALLERVTSRPRTIWTAVAVAFAAVSLGGPFSGAGVATSDRVLLSLFHVVAAAVAIPLLRRSSADIPRAGAN